MLSPVACGFSSEKYVNIQAFDSYTSLTSCGSDVSAEAEFLSQKLSDFDPVEVAEELSLIDKELLIRITWQELSNCGWMSRNKVLIYVPIPCLCANTKLLCEYQVYVPIPSLCANSKVYVPIARSMCQYQGLCANTK